MRQKIAKNIRFLLSEVAIILHVASTLMNSVRRKRRSIGAMLLGAAVYSSIVVVLLFKMTEGIPQYENEGTVKSTKWSPRDKNIKAETTQQPAIAIDPSISQRAPSSELQDSATLQYRERCWRANYSSADRRPVDHTPGQFLPTRAPARCLGDIFLLVVVQSALPHRARRDLIRTTWASVVNIGGDRLQTVFFVGTTSDQQQAEALRRESDSRADIVQADFVDTYRNLTYKHLYAIRWISENCRSVRYIMKVDDDVVLNVFRLRESLRERMASRTGDFFYCQVSRVKPIRDRRLKWHVTFAEWPGDRYPDYCKGFGYVMTFGLVEKLHRCAKWRRYFWIDDVFVSGELASALGAPRIHWEDGWGARRIHPRLAGPEAAMMVLANAGQNLVAPSLHRRLWRAVVRYSDWGREDF